MNFKFPLSKLRKRVLKHKRIFISSACATLSTAIVTPHISSHRRIKLDDESLRKIAETLGVDKSDLKLPISEKDNQLVKEILKFENIYGCKIHFVKSDREGSHYRVDSSFWVDYSKFQGDIYEKFFEIVGDSEIIRECKRRKEMEKLLIRNKNKKWMFSQKDQLNNMFNEWSDK